MKIKMDIYLNGLKKIKRTIQVNDNISLKTFSEYVIISMNGNCKHLYQLIVNEEYAYLGPGCNIIESDMEEMMKDTNLEDLDLDVGDELMLNYDFRCDWEFIIKIKSVNEGYFEKNFEVVSGSGCGIAEGSYGIYSLKEIINLKNKKERQKYLDIVYPELKEYDVNNFDINNINNKIENYLEQYYEYAKPKRYEMNISLEFYNKEIKRKISVDSDVRLYDFCRCVIYSMRGDLSHAFGMKRGKDYIDGEIIEDQDLNYFELKEKQRLKIIYDYGDNWIFNITVAKVKEGYGNKRFEVLSGKGYGIIDDCGGVGGLEDIFSGINKDWGEYDINDFDLEEINRIIDIHF